MMSGPETPSEITEIVVEGYSARYADAVRHVLAIEGDYVDDPADRGGATKFGISLRFLVAEGALDTDGDGFADFDLDMDGDIDRIDIRKLTRGDAVELYHRCFWQPIGASNYPKPIGEMLFDQAVNGGAVAAKKLLQRAVNRLLMDIDPRLGRPALLAIDGQLGETSKAAIRWLLTRSTLDPAALAEAYRDAVRERYREIVRRNPSQQRFLKGWLNRADRLGRL